MEQLYRQFVNGEMYQHNTRITIDDVEYHIDFINWTACVQSTTGETRDIRRISAADLDVDTAQDAVTLIKEPEHRVIKEYEKNVNDLIQATQTKDELITNQTEQITKLQSMIEELEINATNILLEQEKVWKEKDTALDELKNMKISWYNQTKQDQAAMNALYNICIKTKSKYHKLCDVNRKLIDEWLDLADKHVEVDEHRHELSMERARLKSKLRDCEVFDELMGELDDMVADIGINGYDDYQQFKKVLLFDHGLES